MRLGGALNAQVLRGHSAQQSLRPGRSIVLDDDRQSLSESAAGFRHVDLLKEKQALGSSIAQLLVEVTGQKREYVTLE